jgi:hypothetical protein
MTAAAVVMFSLSLPVEIFLLLLYLLLKNPQREGISTFHRPTGRQLPNLSHPHETMAQSLLPYAYWYHKNTVVVVWHVTVQIVIDGIIVLPYHLH